MTQNAETPRRLSGAFQETHAVGAGPIVAQASAGREVRASPGWPPVAIPGSPGWYRHYVDGRQVDLPSSDEGGGRGK